MSHSRSVLTRCPGWNQRGPVRRLAKLASRCLLWLTAAGTTAWAFGALSFDFPVLNGPVSWVFLTVVIAGVVLLRGGWRKLAAVFGASGVVLLWWLTLKPRNDRDWLPEMAQIPWAKVNGDEVTVHNFRNCDYRTETDLTPRWESRTVRLSSITGIDLIICYWGSPWMAHPIVSFQFSDAPPLCFSIETRKEKGEGYSAIGGIYRQYELICIAADERDVIRLRTNFRQGEESYLYRTRISPERARERFLEYVGTINALHAEPQWYHALTTNCTTAIRSQHPAKERPPWNWRLLVNGKADELLYEQNALSTDGLSFSDLKKRALLNPDAQAAGASPDFSRLIRAGRPGFGAPATTATNP